MRDICGILGVNRSSFYYQLERGPVRRGSCALNIVLITLPERIRDTGTRRITQLLVRQGYTVGTRRVARVDEPHNNLLVSVRCVITCQSKLKNRIQGDRFSENWSNLLDKP